MYILGDNTPEEDSVVCTSPPDDVKQSDPSARDESSECEEVDYDTDFEDDVSDTEHDKGIPQETDE